MRYENCILERHWQLLMGDVVIVACDVIGQGEVPINPTPPVAQREVLNTPACAIF
jgi:hypothetical protein